MLDKQSVHWGHSKDTETNSTTKVLPLLEDFYDCVLQTVSEVLAFWKDWRMYILAPLSTCVWGMEDCTKWFNLPWYTKEFLHIFQLYGQTQKSTSHVFMLFCTEKLLEKYYGEGLRFQKHICIFKYFVISYLPHRFQEVNEITISQPVQYYKEK